MKLFGLDPQMVLAAHDEMTRAMRAQEQELRRLRDENASLESSVRELSSKLRNLEKSNESLRTERSAREDRVAKQALQIKEQHDEWLVRNSQLELETERLRRRIDAVERERGDLADRVTDLEVDCDGLRSDVHDRELSLAKASGVIEALIATARLDAASRPQASADLLRRGQAALARGSKRSLAPETRMNALEEAMEILGELPPRQAKQLAELRAEKGD